MKIAAKLFSGVVVAFSMMAVANAGFWDWSRPYQGPSKEITTLIVTGNYTKARVLAELTQGETSQPILLITSEGGKLFFMPGKGPCLEVQDADFTNFVKMVNAKQVLVLGDTRYVPESYIKRMDPKQTIIRVDNKDWCQVAVTVGKILDKTYLAGKFKKLSDQIDSGLYNPGGRGATPASASVPLEPTVIKPIEPVKTEEPVLIKDTEVVPK
ncbi:MAG: hypothetical protein NT118_16580 [Lentisphaerae bacterium]|nr:hypothetical protein [Lentisphaerota bacterium]